MNDQEMLELAAKSIGYKYSDVIFNGEVGLCIIYPEERNNWSSLSYDSDALQLVIELRMSLTVSEDGIKIFIPELGHFEEKFAKGQFNNANIRRAITRVAAEYARTMK